MWIGAPSHAHPPLEASLIGAVEVKLLRIRQYLWIPVVPMGHSLLFAVGAVAAAAWGQDGEAPQSVSRATGRLPRGSRLPTGSPRPSSPRDDEAPPVLLAEAADLLVMPWPDRVFLAPAEFGIVTPHAMQDHGELAGDRDTGAGLGDLHAPRECWRRSRRSMVARNASAVSGPTPWPSSSGGGRARCGRCRAPAW